MPVSHSKKTLPQKLLGWYAQHQRELPWRAKPGEAPNIYKVWLSEIMLQQTTVKAVIPYFEKFLKRWPDVKKLSKAKDEDVMAAWAGLGYYSRARKLIECARLVAKHGDFPQTHDELLELPGIGPYTAAAISSIALDVPAAVVDGNIERVVTRVYAIETPLTLAKKIIREHVTTLTPQKHSGDFAQAMMDLGATICTPRSPKCFLCPIQKICDAFALQQQERFPIKVKKAARPKRFAAAYWIEKDGQILLRRRLPKGLLGGMAEIPSEGWSSDFIASNPLYRLAFEKLSGFVTHTFTHFDLEMSIFVTNAPKKFKTPDDTFWHPVKKIEDAGLPGVMMKVARYALASKEKRAA
ncbi:MAG: A/G-specific adenine glycosylase [Pseudomonadota bacterium]